MPVSGAALPFCSIVLRLKRMLHCVAGVFAAWALLAPVNATEVKMDSLSISPFFVGLSDSPRSIAIEVGGHKMIVPRNYIGSAWFSDGYLALKLLTLFPDFGGVTRENFPTMRRAVGAATPDVIQITRYEGYEHQGEFLRSVSRAARDFGIKTDLDGLVSVQQGFNNANTLINMGFSFFVYTSEDPSDDIHIQCTSKVLNLHNCMVDIRISDGVGFEYEFFFIHLRDWRIIHSRITVMLQTFFKR